MKKTITCIECPVGCSLEVELDGDKIISTTGAKCPKGEVYAHEEVTNPVRVVTSTVAADGLCVKMVPVKTNKPVPKDMISEVMQKIRNARITSPVEVGARVIENILGLDVDVVATRRVGK